MHSIRAFLLLIGQIILISCIHSVMEILIDTNKNKFMSNILNVACYIGSLYLLIDFVFNNILKELASIVTIPF